MGVAREVTTVALDPGDAFDLWTDVRRWPSFVDGFANVERLDEGWPAEGARVVWRSHQGGRGVVSEKVTRLRRGSELVTQVLEERMTGTQTVRLEPAEEGGTDITLELDYSLTSGGPFSRVTDILFIRRAQTDSLRRTLRRFATEAAEEATLS